MNDSPRTIQERYLVRQGKVSVGSEPFKRPPNGLEPPGVQKATPAKQNPGRPANGQGGPHQQKPSNAPWPMNRIRAWRAE
jgi:hypothetical protein